MNEQRERLDLNGMSNESKCLFDNSIFLRVFEEPTHILKNVWVGASSLPFQRALEPLEFVCYF